MRGCSKKSRFIFETLRGYGNRFEYNCSVSYSHDATSKDSVETEWKNAMPYEEIPGPKPYPIIGNIPRFLPWIGEYGNLPLSEFISTLRNTYGDIVRLEGLPGQRRNVLLFDANLSEKVYRNEGVWPSRISMETLGYYRERRGDIYKENLGLTASQGKDWHAFRSKVNQHLMQPRTIKPHVAPIDAVAEDFIGKIRKLRDPVSLEMPGSFNNEINKWSLESICAICFDRRMGCLETGLTPDSDPQLVIDSIHVMFELMYKMEVLPSLWKIYETRDLKKFIRIMDTMTEITGKYVRQAKEQLKSEASETSSEKGMLQRLLSVNEDTATVMVMDMLMAGVDTTGNSTSTAMYYLASNPEVQEELRAEAFRVLPTKRSPVTPATLNDIPFLKAVIKESMRMTPIATGNLRTMVTNVVVGGYRIPKNENVIMCHSVMARDPKQFPNSDKFLPQRWLKDTRGVATAKDAHPFAYMPFGFGPRSCIGRRFAQLEMETLLLKIARNFRMEWHHEPLKFKSRFITTVDSPLRIRLIDLH